MSNIRRIHRDIVGAIILSKDNKVLLGQSVNGGVYKDQWIVPGGGIEDGETKLQAVAREVLEEVGIDISAAKVELIEGSASGQSEKLLRDTGERVLVDMTFYDYIVTLPQNARMVAVSLDDDLSAAQWFTVDEITEANVAEPTRKILETINFVK